MDDIDTARPGTKSEKRSGQLREGDFPPVTIRATGNQWRSAQSSMNLRRSGSPLRRGRLRHAGVPSTAIDTENSRSGTVYRDLSATRSSLRSGQTTVYR